MKPRHLVFASLFMLACTDQPTAPDPSLAKGGNPTPPCDGVPVVDGLRIDPSKAELFVGASRQFTVTNLTGDQVPSCALKWASSNAAVATVTGGGVVTGIALGGPISIKAQTGGKKPYQVTASIAVIPPPSPVTVLGTANVFGYGVTTPAPAGGGGGTLGTILGVANVAGSWVEVSATGQAAPDCCTFQYADGFGVIDALTNLAAVDPISGYSGLGAFMLVGVFITDGDISGLPAPAALPYGPLSDYQFSQYSPGLRQVFFVGDGLTGNNFDGGNTGARQKFYVPAGATKLVLGFADGYGFRGLVGGYYNNTGTLTVTVQQRLY